MPWAVRDMQIKATRREHCTPARMVTTFKIFLMEARVGTDVEELEPSYITGGNVKWGHHWGMQLGRASKH